MVIRARAIEGALAQEIAMNERQVLLSILSGSMARICGADEACDQSWMREAEALVTQHILREDKLVTLDLPAGLVEPLDWWQNERIRLDSDFPLMGSN